MPKRNEVQIIINADDKASRKIGGIKGALGGFKSALGGIGKVAMVGFGAIAAGAAGAAAGILKLASDAAAIEPIERDFARLAESIGETTDAMITGMRDAAYGMVSDADLMQSANRLISMGLAESAEEAGELTRMAVRLGEAMGKGPTEAMEEFALMMANQSIPRLDTFGISAGQVRERMAELTKESGKGGLTQQQLSGAIGKSSQKLEELQQKLFLATLRQSELTDKAKESTRVSAQMRIDKLNQQLAEEQQRLGNLRNTTVSLTGATKALTREEAFAQAVRELGAESLERVGEGGKGAAASMARLQAMFANLKNTVGKAFIPVLAAALEPLGQLAEKYGPLVIDWAEKFSGWLQETGIPAVKEFAKNMATVIPDAIKAVRDAFSTLGKYFGAVLEDGDYLNDWLMDLPAPVRRMVQAMGKIVKILVPVKDAIIDMGRAAWVWIQGTAIPILTTLGVKAQEWIQGVAIPAIQGFIGDIDWAGILGRFEGLLGGLGEIKDRAVEWITGVAIPAIQGFLKDIDWAGIVEKVRGIITKLGELKDRAIEWVTGTAIPAIQGFIEDIDWAAIREKISGVITKLGELKDKAVEWITETAVPALQGLLEDIDWEETKSSIAGVGTSVADAFQDIDWAGILGKMEGVEGFIRENLNPILAGLGAIILAVVVPAFVAWAISAGAAAVATVLALLPVALMILGLLALGVAVGLLVAAWERDWGGIQTFTTDLWTNTLQPTFESIKEWLEVTIPLATETLVGVWNDTFLPAGWAVANFSTETLTPAFQDLIGTLSDLGEEIGEKVSEKMKTFISDALSPLRKALEGVWGDVKTLIGWLKKLKEAIESINLPPFLKKGSLSPLEQTLAGVADMARAASRALRMEFAASMKPMVMPGGAAGPTMAGAGGGGRTVIIAHLHLDPREYQNVRGDANYYAVEQLLDRMETRL